MIAFTVALPVCGIVSFISYLLLYCPIFSAHDSDLGCTKIISHDIPLLDETPVTHCYRRVSPSDYEDVKEHIYELLSAQVIRESCSPYASPIVLVKKKGWEPAYVCRLPAAKQQDQERCVPAATH